MTEEDYAALGLKAPPARIDVPGMPGDVASLIERAAAKCPDDEALVDARRSYSFRELAQAVAAASALMDEAGIGQGDRVAAALGNENNLVVAFFAAMRLGAVWVGINKILPVDDKRHILAHSGAKLFITDTSLEDQADALRGDAPDLAHLWIVDSAARDGGWNAALADAANAVAPMPQIDPFAPAAIMYTSGTTGVPKGVVHSQHNMIVVPAAAFAHGLMAPDARRGSALPLTITNVMILGPVSAFLACRPFLFAPSIKIEPLIEWIGEKQIGQLAFVPTMIYDLLQANLDLPEHFRMSSGGAPLPQAIRETFFRRYGYHISPSYGLTEAPTVVAHSFDAVPPEGASGHTLPHLEITIRDGDGSVLPTGTVGEVCFGPVQNGAWANVYTPPLGYWRDSEKTAALLRGGVVHSGDHGSLDEQGWLTIADRSSELILRGGSNVYPAEIERVLHSHDGVADCAVIGRPDLRMGMLTVACIQPASPESDNAALEAELVALCREKLTRYKVPDEWQFLDAFPRNAMGKVVKPRLREMVISTD
ncbi:MAG: class I adenylate-forming enzyme family protein [Blastomonas sp.]